MCTFDPFFLLWNIFVCFFRPLEHFCLLIFNMWFAQELDEYDTFYKKNMENSGYSSIYIQRSGDKRDGCGIFYKPKRYPYCFK